MFVVLKSKLLVQLVRLDQGADATCVGIVATRMNERAGKFPNADITFSNHVVLGLFAALAPSVSSLCAENRSVWCSARRVRSPIRHR